MSDILVVFPRRETAVKIRNILVRGGLKVSCICTTGAQVLQYADALDCGVVVCGYKMSDMMYTELREYLPESFHLLLIASPEKGGQECMDGVVKLPMPMKGYDLLNTVEMILQSMYRRKKKRKSAPREKKPEEYIVIRQAKAVLMERNGMSEDDAHHYLQKCSMDSGNNLLETAEMILTIMEQ